MTGRFSFCNVTNSDHLRERLQLYDNIIPILQAALDDMPELAIDIAELERHRNNVHDYYFSLTHKRGPNKPRVKSEKEQRMGSCFRARNVRRTA